MPRARTITVRNKRAPKETVDILGLSHADCRLLAGALNHGAFAGGDQGGPVTVAIARFASALSVPYRFPSQHADVKVVGSTSDASILFEELVNL